MNNQGQNARKSDYLVILLAVVGLVEFSSAMKDLTQLHRFALDARDLVASWSTEVAPAVEIPSTVVKLETCEIKRSLEQSIPSVQLPWLDDVAAEKTVEVREVEPLQVAERARRTRVRVVRPGRVSEVDFDPVQLEVRVSSDHAAGPDVMISEFPHFSFKTKTRKPNVIRISPRDREMLLKTINRSINLRIAS
jgi:hypothetical protein